MIYFGNHKLFDEVKGQKKPFAVLYIYYRYKNKHLTTSENIKASFISKCGCRTVVLTVFFGYLGLSYQNNTKNYTSFSLFKMSKILVIFLKNCDFDCALLTVRKS